MAMVINTNEQATRIHSIYTKNVGQMNAAMTRIATTQKLNSAKDGASNWAISAKMRERIRANDQANQNIQNDTALLKTAQDGFSNNLTILSTLRDRAINAADDANTYEDRKKIAEEVKQLIYQIDDNAAKVKFNNRQLLNGAVDPTSGASAASGVGTVEAKSVTATNPQGTHAVYSLTGLRTASGDAVTASTNLVDLVDSDGNAIFHKGDTIKINWVEDGAQMESSVAVTSSTALSAVVGSSPALGTAEWKKQGESLTATDAHGNALGAGETGLYIYGAANTNISEVKFSVTDGNGNTRVAAQKALEVNPIQQSYGSDDSGSNQVYNVAVTNYVATFTDPTNSSLSSDNTDDTAFWHFSSDPSANGGTDTKDNANSVYKLTINGIEVEFKGSNTINQINDKLKEAGIDVRLHYTQTAKETLYYEGEAVTKGSYGGATPYEAETGLNIIAARGYEINSMKLENSDSAGTKLAEADRYDISKGNSNRFIAKLALDTTSPVVGGTSSSSELLPQGETLQFYVGGESNFGINFSIGKATVQNLFGTSADEFAKNFETKEGAESALTVIEDAINKTLVEQTRLGAMEARLGYTSENLSSMNTNLEASESAYRDADISKEMTDYMKYSLLSQSSQLMLAQATQNPFQILSLLQP